MRVICMAGLLALHATFQVVALAQNNYVGTCQGFQQYLVNTGVTDANGVHHPGWDGVTIRRYTIKSVDFVGERTLRLKGVAPSEVCASAKATLQISVTPFSDVLTWTPQPQPCNCDCETAIDQWHQDIQDHEQKHAAQAQSYVNMLNDLFVNYPVQACVPREGRDLEARLKSAWALVLQAEIDLLDQQIQGQRESIDRNDKSAPFPGCSQCAPCGANQQPVCVSCPNGLIPAAGQCNRSADRSTLRDTTTTAD